MSLLIRRDRVLRHQIRRVLEVALGAGTTLVKHALVEPVEIKGQVQRLAHALVGKARLTQVNDQSLHAGGPAVRDFFLDQFTAVKAPAPVAPHPGADRALLQRVDSAGLDRFLLAQAVAKILVADLVKIEHAPAHRQIGGPVVGAAAVDDGLAEIDLLHRIGAAGDRRLGDDLVYRLAPAPGMREHRQLANDHVQFRVLALEVKTYGVRIDHHGLLDVGPVRAERRAGLLAGQRVEGVLHVLRQHRVAVGKPRQRVQMEAHAEPVRRQLDVVCQQAVAGEGFVLAGRGQRIKHQAVFGKHKTVAAVAHADRDLAFECEGIEFVKASAGRQHQLATLGRVRVHIVEMGEICSVFGRVAHAHGGHSQARKRQRPEATKEQYTHATILPTFDRGYP